ncbi:MAG: type II secretion system F family protein [Nanoarchaeota archaeon]|nr:type II secretion system F family protein [Nanoarchaeota archaeon]
MSEEIKQILNTADKLIIELENLVKDRTRSELKINAKNKLLERLSQLSVSLLDLPDIPLHRTKVRKEDEAHLTKKISDNTLREIGKRIREKDVKKREKETIELRKPNSYTTASNLLFHNLAHKIAQNNKDISDNLKKANLAILADSFVSVTLMNTLLALIAGIIIAILFSFLSIKFVPYPIISFAPLNAVKLILNLLAWPLILAVSMFLVSFYYPKLEAMSRINKIDDEIPFATMHMSAIVGSGVQPTKVFYLISDTDEYKNFNVETKRIINKINFYGYDLLTALKETAKTTPSSKARDLFNGMASIIATGGDIRSYLEKKASGLMVDYKLKRKKFADAASVYADIYTGLLITAPIIFGVLLSMITPLGGNLLGFNPENIAIAGLVVIVMFNIGFIIFLNAIQPPE